MECNELKEVMDSYLCDELAVETNLRVINHLEGCAVCRQEMSVRRDLRGTLKSAVVGSPEFRIDPAFAAGLRDQLRGDAAPRGFFGGWKIFMPVAAAVIIVVSVSFALLFNRSGNLDPALQAYMVEMSAKAIGDHRYCALDKLKLWESSKDELTAEQSGFIKALADNGIEVLDAHDCIFDGKSFGHFVLRRGDKIISVARVASEVASATNSNMHRSILTERDGGFQVASFQFGANLVFVVSDLSEPENLAMARELSDSLES